MNDVGFATANAIIELEYWRKVHKDNWIKIWSSYNTGFSYRRTQVFLCKRYFRNYKKKKMSTNYSTIFLSLHVLLKV